jgi:hypothetical protein
MNQHRHDHPSGHDDHTEQRRQFHKDWRVWVGVIAILAALASYVLTNNGIAESDRSGDLQRIPDSCPRFQYDVQ